MRTGRPITKNVADLKGSSVSFRISLEDHALLRQLAKKKRISQTEVFEQAIRMMARRNRIEV